MRHKVTRSPVLAIVVTQPTIDRAIRENSNHCMIAESITEQHPKYAHISVDLQTIRLSDPTTGLRHIYLTPRIAQQALVLFDQGKRMRPFDFKLRGAHTVAMQLTSRQKGKPVKERIKLGRRRIVKPGSNGAVPDTFGGRAVPKHPSSSTARAFGMRAFTPGDLEDVGLKK